MTLAKLYEEVVHCLAFLTW